MKIMSKVLLNCSLFAMLPVLANAAGTYYNGMYQSPQNRYAQQPYAAARQGYQQQGYQQQGYQQNQQQRMGMQNYSNQGVSAYNQNQYANAGYSTNNMNGRQPQMMQNAQNMMQGQPGMPEKKSGFRLGAGFEHQFANWQFNMKEAGSKLHYDNIAWNVLGVNAGFEFDAGAMAIDIKGGFKYGMQSGESTMVDDDISNGGYFITQWGTDANGDGTIDSVLGDQIGHALSIGTSRDGTMMEFNAGIGLKDVFSIGRMKITPTVGWRYLKYELETQDNYGMSLDTYTGEGGCITVDGETQCDTVLIFYDSAGNKYLAHRTDTNTSGGIDVNDEIPVPGGYDKVNAGSTYYYAQPGISHKYEVEWSGPYVALDMLYDIDQNNYVNAYVELGFPSYTATGDQPYRFDWAHPKSVEDKTDMGGALHFGAGANWATALTDNVALSIGLTYDYYTVSDADASTYLNESYYTGIYNNILSNWVADGKGDEAAMLNPTTGDQTAIAIKQLEEECPGWVCSAPGEIESFYKSLGVRVGLNAKF